MPQFDLNLLNFQNIIIYVFCISYLFYLKEINVVFFYLLKLPYLLNLYILIFFFEKKIFIDSIYKKMISLLLSTFNKIKLLSFILSIENNYFFYYII